MEVLKLSQAANIIMGQSPPSATYNTLKEGLPFFQGKADFGAVHPTVRIYCSRPAKVAQQDDILMSVRAPVGDVNIADRGCAIGRGLAAIRAIKEVAHQEFLYFALTHNKNNIAQLGSGSIFQAINKSQLFNFPITLFPYHEQEAIGHVLSIIQKAIRKQQEIIFITKCLKKAMLNNLFTEGTKSEQIIETEIGMMPKSWKIKKLGELCNISSGGTPRREIKEFWSGGVIPWVKTGEINYRLITSTSEKITRLGLKSSSAKMFPAGTLLMAMYGQGVTRGRVAILGIDATINQACAAIIPSSEKEVSSKYLHRYFEFQYENIRELGHGANQKNLSGTIIKEIPIAYPPHPEEQKLIYSSIDAIEGKLEYHKKKRSIYEALFKSLLNDLMTGTIHVKDIDFQPIYSFANPVKDSPKTIAT